MYVPLTCIGHSRPVGHIEFSNLQGKELYLLISACKDGLPMLRNGVKGDWVGTYFGHKGAVWCVRLSPDASNAASASADFTCKIWDTDSGELKYTIQHEHIVRCVAFPLDNSNLVATGGMEKKLRVFDLAEFKFTPGAPITIPAEAGFEIGEGVHQAAIKSICWTSDPNVLVTASGKTLRWFHLPSRSVIHQRVLDGEIGSCEMVSLAPEWTSEHDIGGGLPVLAVAAGKAAYFWGGRHVLELLKCIVLPYTIASVGIDLRGRKIVVGENPGTWARVISYDDHSEIDILKGHHGPIWSVAFSPDAQLYATASEDGTIKMWKNCEGFYGLWQGGNERDEGDEGDETSAE
ncbi:WD40-repeat-containing domain protein [Trichoderma sp. SZMC 28014]